MNGQRPREIVKIDQEKCDGCGLCVPSCAEGAIRIIDGKARLVADNLCDGLGNCLGTCPQGAITIERREAEAFDEEAVGKVAAAGDKTGGEAKADSKSLQINVFEGCPGTMARKLSPAGQVGGSDGAVAAAGPARTSRLGQWPVQLALVPVAGPIWQDADVLIAADCVGFALPDFHERLLVGKTLVIACPKLDEIEPYVAKLTDIFAGNPIRSITVAHMEVPCCNGIVRAVEVALAASGRIGIRIEDITVGLDGTISSVSQR